jgi:hypothetical protein
MQVSFSESQLSFYLLHFLACDEWLLRAYQGRPKLDASRFNMVLVKVFRKHGSLTIASISGMPNAMLCLALLRVEQRMAQTSSARAGTS